MEGTYDSLPSTSAGESIARSRTMPVQCEPMKFTDLVDDCLFAIYTHLDINDLGTIADVSQRLRSTSKFFFVQSGINLLDYPSSIITYDEVRSNPLYILLLRTSRVLRNFGSFITTYDESCKTIFFLCHWFPRDDWGEFEMKFVALLQYYCGESLTVLKLHDLRFTDAMANIREPIFPRVQTFEWRYRENDIKSCPLLSIWLPEVREISLGDFSLMLEASMHNHFEQLTKASLRYDWPSSSIERFLMLNPQLKELHLNHIEDFSVLESIGKYTKDIEVLCLASIRKQEDEEYPTTSDCFSELKKLRRFELREDFCMYPKGEFVVRNIVSAVIPLKSLTIVSLGRFIPDIDLLLKEIVKLKSLETLNLDVALNKKEDLIHICTQLDQLCELSVDYGGVWNTADVLKVVQVTTKLQWLYLKGEIDFDDNIHEQLKDAIGKRSENSQFVLKVREPRDTRICNRPECNNGEEPEIKPLKLSSDWYPQIGLRLEASFIDVFWEYELTVCGHTNVGTGRCGRQHEDLAEFPIQFKDKYLREKINKCRRASRKPPLKPCREIMQTCFYT